MTLGAPAVLSGSGRAAFSFERDCNLMNEKRYSQYYTMLWCGVLVFVIGASFGDCVGSCSRSTAGAQVAVAAIAVAASSPCASDRCNDTAVGPVLALARLCVNESGMRAYAYDDCASIHAVIVFRAAYIYRTDYLTALHRYSHRVTLYRPGRNRPWIVQLWPHARQPALWRPHRARWTGRYGRWWRRTYMHARAVYRGEIGARCAPHTWGSQRRRPSDRTAEQIDCGHTINRFWSVPSYARRWPALAVRVAVAQRPE